MSPSGAVKLPDPYALMRGFTLALFGFWTIRGYWRTLRLLRRWTAIARRFGLSAAFVRGEVARFVLRVTVLDPVNVALLATAVIIWGRWL